MTTRTTSLRETATLRRNGAVWEAVLITPGTGSSGEYTDELLEAAVGSRVFPKASKNWFMHKEWRGQQRDPRDQWGYLGEDARFEEGVGLVAPIHILPHWVDVVEALAEAGQAELSIYASAAINEDTGEIIALVPNTLNSVDLVDYPGRPGSRLASKIERAREAYKPAAESSAEEKETHMDEKERKEFAAAVVASVLESLKPVVDFVTNAKTAEEKATQSQVDDQAIESAVESAVTAYDEKVKAIKDAKLFPFQEEALLESARKGHDVEQGIADATKVVEAAKDALKGSAPVSESAGTYVVDTASESAADDFSINVGGK
jgi:hypothetical protein